MKFRHCHFAGLQMEKCSKGHWISLFCKRQKTLIKIRRESRWRVGSLLAIRERKTIIRCAAFPAHVRAYWCYKLSFGKDMTLSTSLHSSIHYMHLVCHSTTVDFSRTTTSIFVTIIIMLSVTAWRSRRWTVSLIWCDNLSSNWRTICKYRNGSSHYII